MMLAAALLSGAAACTKEGPGTDPLDGVPISICATAPETKAMLDANAFKHDGNRIIIYDFVDNATAPYFSDLIGPDVLGSDYANSQKPTNGVWPFVNGPHQWTPGTHNFFGWLDKDVNKTTETTDDLTPVSLFGNTFATVDPTDDEPNVTVAAFNAATRTLEIPATEINADSPQFDFMYSDIYSTEPQNDPVDLKFSHLFSAVSFGVANGADEVIQVNNISIKLYTSRSAYIDFSGTSAACAYNKDLGNPAVFVSNSTNGEIDAGDTKENAFDFSKKDRSYYLLWPLFNSDDADDDEIDANCTITIEFSYDSNGNASDGYENKQSRILPFPDVDLEPGKRYHFTLGLPSQTKLDVTLKCEVCPWETASTDIEFN